MGKNRQNRNNESGIKHTIKIGNNYLESAELVENNYKDTLRPDGKKVNIKVYEVKDPQEFLKVLKDTWNKIPENQRWKVEAPQNETEMTEWINDHPNVKMWVTSNGSTVAVNGQDIISVASPKGVSEGFTTMQWAIDQGGRKLDSYASNYGFYRKLGFKRLVIHHSKKGLIHTGKTEEMIKKILYSWHLVVLMVKVIEVNTTNQKRIMTMNLKTK